MSPLQAWRTLADTFRATDLLVRWGKLPADFKPEDAIFLYREGPLSTHERNILGFLLHVWNKYDFPFESVSVPEGPLSEVEGWDPRHQQAFIGWDFVTAPPCTGKNTHLRRVPGRPMRYF